MPTLPASVFTSEVVWNLLLAQLAVSVMICMVPMPPSQARIVDCHPLSSQAIASTSSGRSVMAGPPMFGQTGLPAAATSAALTSAVAALGPVRLGHVAPGDGEAVTGGGAGCV